jgi:Putative adhesin
MENLMRPLVAALILLLSLAAPAAPSAAGDAAQKVSVPLSDPGRPATLKVSTINGSITVEGYAGREVSIETSSRGEEPEGRPRRGAEGMRRIPNRDSGLSVDEDANVVRVETRNPAQGGDLHIQVPFHTSLHLSAINGGKISVSGVEGEIELSHVNGSIEARDVAGSVVAHTTNGNVKVMLRQVVPDKAMAFSTLNGNVDVTFPADLKAQVRVRSERGEIYSDFEIAAQGHAVARETRKEGKRHVEVSQEIRGAIGGGGPEILFKTFNGDIFIRRPHG